METEAEDPHAKRRKTEAHDRHESDELLISPQENHAPPELAADALHLKSTTEAEPSHDQEPPPGAGDEGRDAVDRISSLPDEILGEIISLLPTKDGARTRALASRWRHLWLSAPLNINYSGLPFGPNEERIRSGPVISWILASHPGPALRFSMHDMRSYPKHQAATVNAWLRSPALDKLQELEFYAPPLSIHQGLPASAFRFSATLRVMDISGSRLLFDDSVAETLRFPQLGQLGLTGVVISVGRLNSLIAGCPNLEYLLLSRILSDSDRPIRINSPNLKRFAFALFSTKELIIEDAPLLERLFQLDICPVHVLVISAPKLEIVGGITDCYSHTKFTIGATVIEQLRASFTTTVCSVKFLAIDNNKLSLDIAINLIRCFPCLEKFCVKTSHKSESKNLWRRKYRNLIRCLDIHLKVLVLKNYRGIKSQANFATFFILNAKRLESVRFEGGPYKNYNTFIQEQHWRLQLEKRASRDARFHFISCACHSYVPHIMHVNDLSKADPYECKCPSSV